MLYASIMDDNPNELGSADFADFLAVKVQHTKTAMINVLDIITNVMNLFEDNVGKKEKVCGFAKHQ